MMMLDKESQAFLEELLITPSPTGYESKGQKVWREYVKNYSDKVESDAYGSVVAKIETNMDVATIMLEAHADEIGMVVQHISDDGFITLNKLGGSDSTIARAKRVFIHNKKGRVLGVTGNKAIHLQDSKNGGGKQPAWKDIYVDIGAGSKEEALELVQVGDPVTYTDEIEYLNDEIIAARALDNRIGGFVIAQVMRRLRKRKKELKVNVMALNSVQEEVGGFGARMMSYRHMPDAALVTDVTHATDTPGINNKEHGTIKLGKGPSVQHGGANHPSVVSLVEKAAKKAEISIQHEATSVRTGTDTDSIFYQRTGIPSALISLPIRYMHSPVETASLKDVEALISLMTESILAMEPDQTFSVFE
ncbi:M20/M25/M40 family metallo-hydrolase [Rhodohalobacter sp.]|uniref:M20/M25/M40 family metallo-hydrolase n=1 Tax=Rhodohalobacter sp. TaxID=1974210 RepID=UPI002ACD5954|nr:M20/M25/M40 family metallo-hydrolase [Rhodohalobacter sp.]MDZ7757551.1 M20/M25/M40 family metallo-hydrolase [Rhodohalobacter sp.]